MGAIWVASGRVPKMDRGFMAQEAQSSQVKA